MGMSTHVIGFMPADAQWQKMKAVWEACELAGVKPPDEVIDFFGDESPEDRPGREVELGNAAKEYSGDMQDGYEIDVTALPAGVRFIRVYNSY